MTDFQEIVLQVAHYLHKDYPDVLKMDYREFNLWLQYIDKHPSLEKIIDSHLSNIQYFLVKTNSKSEEVKDLYPFEFSELINIEDKETLKKHLLQEKLIKELDKFGKE